MKSGDVHRYMKSGDVHRYMKSGNVHRYMKSGDVHRDMEVFTDVPEFGGKTFLSCKEFIFIA